MRNYDVKPYNPVILTYLGGSEFDVAIFNEYAVEIDYTFNILRNPTNPCLWSGSLWQGNDFEVAKIASTFTYNAYYSGRVQSSFLVRNKYLKKREFYKILSAEETYYLGINPSMKWIELGFKKLMWHISLRWENGTVLFSKGWYKLTKAGRLNVGDMCVFLTTSNSQRFQLAVFQKASRDNFYKGGIGNGKSLLKWFKILGQNCIDSGQMEIPRVFAEEFGQQLGLHVVIFLADGRQYNAAFCKISNTLFHLTGIFGNYSVAKKYVLFFDYIGRSTSYLSIFNEFGLNILSDLSEKLLLSTVINHYREEEEEELNETADSNENSTECVDDGDRVEENQFLQPFTTILKRTHVDNSGHGVYFARHLLRMYRGWKNSSVVTLLFKDKLWKVEVHRYQKFCRFGKGWDRFSEENGLVEGQKLQFSYVEDYSFNVTLCG